MTDKEKAIVMAHTGICMLSGDKFQIFHKYIEDIMGRPIMTHEIGLLVDAIKEKSKADFIALCTDESCSENPNRWIPVSERPPEDRQKCLISIEEIVDIARYSTNLYEVDKFDFYDKNNVSGFYSYDGECGYFQIDNVEAWIPLPKSYRVESEE